MKMNLLFATFSLATLHQWLAVDAQSSWWTWLSGVSGTNDAGIYGTQGIPSTNNVPASRYGHSMVLDPNLNCVYVFGGTGSSKLPHDDT